MPEAFDDLPGGLVGPVVFAFAYLAVRLFHLGIFWLAAREHDPGLRRQLLRFAPSVLGSTACCSWRRSSRGRRRRSCGSRVLVVDYVGTILGGASGWRLNSASHFAERHGLIVIIALGESIVATASAWRTLPISWPIIVASMLGLALAACIWWAYFDVLAIVAERVLRGRRARSAPASRATRTATCICR